MQPPAAGAPGAGAAPSFSAAQAAAGKQQYRQYCASCHGEQLEGNDIAPSLNGERFDRTWRGKSAEVLSFHVHRMPPEGVAGAGSLDDGAYANLLAYVLLANGFAAGEEALPVDRQSLSKLVIPPLSGSEADVDAPAAGTLAAAARSRRLASLPAVTPEMLRDPSPNDWLLWGRTYDGSNWSPLQQINKENVAGLKPAWRVPLRTGTSMPTPLVHAGVMFLHTYPDTVLAIDAESGLVLWRYRYERATLSSQKMGVALGGEKVLVPTSDLHVIALGAKTGEPLWDHEILPETPPAMRPRYQLRSAPLVVKDKVIQGVTASFVPKGGFILAIDLETGKEVWRFNTIARPGEPHGHTWNDLPLDKRSGGSVWHQGTYDAASNLVYFGVAPTYDTGPLLHAVGTEGITSDALYTNCTVALDADTGRLVWHYQHMANDQWDLDWVFERQILELAHDDGRRKAVINVGKMAILEALDAATGEYLFSIDAGVQNVIAAIDPKTGKKTYDPEKMPDPERPCVICPSAFGARSWPPTSYSPQTKLLYVPLTEWCMGMGPRGFRLFTSGVGLTSAAHPGSGDGMLGRLQAFALEQQKLAWAVDQRTPLSTSTLATAGGLVFSGDLDPALNALDAMTGELLWRFALDDLPSAYAIDGMQYVVVVVGFTNNHVRDLARTYKEFSASDEEAASVPGGGAAIWAFSL
jgi:alcohol dehydrogenase (cytochrome c)